MGPQVVARPHLANSVLSVGFIVNLFLDSFPPHTWDFSPEALLVEAQIPLTWTGLLLLEKLQLDLLLSMKQEGFVEAWQPALVKKNWLPERDSFFQPALKSNSKNKRSKNIEASRIGHIAAGKIRFRDEIAIHNTIENSS